MLSLKIKKIIEYLNHHQVNLVAVTKNRSLNEVKQLIDMGITKIGENRIKEAEQKLPFISKVIEKHFIGKIQTNKIKKIVRLFDVIQSVDQIKQLALIDQCAALESKKIKVLIQVKISDEAAKGGCAVEELEEMMQKAVLYTHLEIIGLMALASNTENKIKVRNEFVVLKNEFDVLRKKDFFGAKLQFLSLGMSNDYQIAISAGSNMVRLGRILFE
jgi:hypothetical protein